MDKGKKAGKDRPDSSRRGATPPPNRKPRGSGHERLGEILQAAKDLFLEHGPENVSTRLIARRVGISQTALYTHFETKDEILEQLSKKAFEKLGAALGAIDATRLPPRAWLELAIPEYIRFGLRHPDEYRLAFVLIRAYKKPSDSGQIAEPSERQQVGLGVFRVMEGRIRAGIEAGSLRSDLGTPLAVAQIVWASIHGLVALLISRPHFPWEDRESLIRIQTALLLDGLLPAH